MHHLSAHFTLEELCKSALAARRGIDNRPDLATPAGRRVLAALQALCAHVLEPVRTHFAVPFRPSSGYRCLALNRLIGSRDSSQHLLGQAVDFEVPGVDNAELAAWIGGNLDYDQLILEYHTPGVPASGWVHCSYAGAANRRQDLTVTPEGTFAGLIGRDNAGASRRGSQHGTRGARNRRSSRRLRLVAPWLILGSRRSRRRVVHVASIGK